MHTCYYTILYRPAGCLTWTPVSPGAFEDPKGNFFANHTVAAKAAQSLARQSKPTYLRGLKKWAPLQFTIGYVCIADSPDIISSPAPSSSSCPTTLWTEIQTGSDSWANSARYSKSGSMKPASKRTARMNATPSK